ncbi:MAG: hypothetical protein WB808_13995 [Candidatus Dormiibacterota bacterium]
MGVFKHRSTLPALSAGGARHRQGAASRPRGARVVPALGAALAVLVAMFSSAGGAAAARGSAAVATAHHAGNYAVPALTRNIFNLPTVKAGAALRAAPRTLAVRGSLASKSRARTGLRAPVATQLLAGASSAGAGTISGVKFQGMADSASICPYFGGCQPPDMALAASPKYVLQGVNTSYEIFKTNGTPWIGPINDLTWYGVPPLPGNCDPLGPFMSDPRAFYDPNTGLFWTATLQVEAAAFGVGSSCPNTSIYWVAVVNPATGVQHVYHFDMTLGGTVNAGADYTQFGFSGKTISFTGNMFDFTTGNYDFAEVQFADKATMEAGNPVTSVAFTDLTVGSVPVDTVQPVETETTPANDPGVQYLVNAFNIFGDPFGDDCFFTACHGFVVWAYDPSNQTLGGNLADPPVGSPTYASPPNADEPGCVQCVETIDTRITGTPVYSVGGGQPLISFSLDTVVNNGGAGGSSFVAGILWGQIQVTHFSSIPFPNLYQHGYLAFAGDQAASFGAMMQDKKGRLVMVFDTMSGTLNPSIMVAQQSAGSPLGALGTPKFLIKGPSATFDSRWGDFEAASYDGFGHDQNHIWVASQYSVSGDWNTLIGKV